MRVDFLSYSRLYLTRFITAGGSQRPQPARDASVRGTSNVTRTRLCGHSLCQASLSPPRGPWTAPEALLNILGDVGHVLFSVGHISASHHASPPVPPASWVTLGKI